jgi:hypothetical protein
VDAVGITRLFEDSLYVTAFEQGSKSYYLQMFTANYE